jgi:hypothetical protein
MRVARVRLTVRRMMVAVAVVAVVVGATRRRHALLEAAAHEERLEFIWRHEAELDEIVYFGPTSPDRGRRGAMYRRIANGHQARRIRYERAARYPWLPVVPEPHKPK